MIPLMMRINKALRICGERIGSDNVKFIDATVDGLDGEKVPYKTIQVTTTVEIYHELYDELSKDFEPGELWFWCKGISEYTPGIIYVPMENFK